jgi:DNA mismatch repair ATPase MutS
MLAEWVSKPTRDKDIIDYRHESIRYFLQSDMRNAMQELSGNLKHIKNIHRLLAKVKESKSSSNDWQYILKVLFSLRVIECATTTDTGIMSLVCLLHDSYIRSFISITSSWAKCCFYEKSQTFYTCH